jgi:hypothetical protein
VAAAEAGAVADGPCRTAFATTKKVTTHRFTLGSPDQLATLDELFREAADTVGPGTREAKG